MAVVESNDLTYTPLPWRQPWVDPMSKSKQYLLLALAIALTLVVFVEMVLASR